MTSFVCALERESYIVNMVMAKIWLRINKLLDNKPFCKSRSK